MTLHEHIHVLWVYVCVCVCVDDGVVTDEID